MRRCILLSGGMDSTVLLWKTVYIDNVKDILLLSFDYGSAHAEKELSKAKTIFSLAQEAFPEVKLEHRIIPLDFSSWGMKSGLLASQKDIPEGHYEEKSMEKTVVPFRNGIMLSIAAGLLKEGILLYGGHAGDHAIYPDCRKEFVSAMSQAISRGTNNWITLEAPFASRSKREIAQLGGALRVPFEETWSCYNGREKHCGKCGTCVERKEALEGFDPTEYEEEEV